MSFLFGLWFWLISIAVATAAAPSCQFSFAYVLEFRCVRGDGPNSGIVWPLLVCVTARALPGRRRLTRAASGNLFTAATTQRTAEKVMPNK